MNCVCVRNGFRHFSITLYVSSLYVDVKVFMRGRVNEILPTSIFFFRIKVFWIYEIYFKCIYLRSHLYQGYLFLVSLFDTLPVDQTALSQMTG
jgi:hypothetical protein